MASNEEIFELTISGIPRVAETIASLSDEQKATAFQAVEQAYLRAVLDLDYSDADARNWVGAVMENLRAEVAERGRPEAAVVHDNLEPVA
jgi:hypothetical protein